MQRILIRFRSGARADQTEVFPLVLHQNLYLGRDPACQVRFDLDRDMLVSRNHAVIEWGRGDPPRFRINDLLSTNGTFVNGRRISEPTDLKSGDQLQFGLRGPIVEFIIDDVPTPPSLERYVKGDAGAIRERSTQRVAPVPEPATLRYRAKPEGDA